MKNYMKWMCLIVSICMLAGCSFLSPAKGNYPNQYVINKMPCYVPVKKKRAIVLLVTKPEVKAMYNTTQMAYMIRPYQISYYSLNQWAETPDEMLQPLLVQTMQNTHHFKAVVTPPYNGIYDYELNTEILSLLQDYTCRMPVLVMTVRAQIIKSSRNRVIATRQFTVVQPLPQRSPYGGVFAANAATAHILERVAVFGLEAIR